MHILVYEWVSGGGMLGYEGAIPAGLLREGMAMARAVGEDFAQFFQQKGRKPQVTLLRDVRVMDLVASGCTITAVDSVAMRDDLLEAQFEQADAVLLIAPETDGHLLSLVRQAQSAGARLISPNSDFVQIASDKSKTATRLAAAGVPAPRGIELEPEESLPQDFTYPAVVKPIDGAGSQDTYLLSGPRDSPPPYAWPRRLEPFHTGIAASVAVLCAIEHATALQPCRQHLTTDGRLSYHGGSSPLPPGLAQRASSLALAAIKAMPPAVGYVGVDLVLGAHPAGREDVVIEINPRLTTSYTGLRYAAQQSLAGAMLTCHEGRAPEIEFQDQPFEFRTDGQVTYTSPS